ncbi:DUF1467 family protein [Parasphingorhabdus sp.]|uniref:DUF1467 family protein n=1 Tax=Parasphingorhabdus sp. TaxID=2709688 RepID=UPI003002D790
MQLVSIIFIYVLFWTVSVFIVLPIGIRNHREMGVDMVEGQSDGAPANYKPVKLIFYTTLLATAFFALFYLNYSNQWITIENLDFFGSRERLGL